MSDNLELWNKVSKTDPKHTKKVSKGALQLTAINATYQVKNATEEWGKYGEKWGIENIELDYIHGLCNDQILCVGKARFFYPDGNFEIGSSILVQSWVSSKSYNKVDEDFLKKLETDMVTKSLSKLGFNADVFLGLYDDNKYIQSLQDEFNASNEGRVNHAERLKSCKTLEELKQYYQSLTPNEQKNFAELKDKLKLELK